MEEAHHSEHSLTPGDMEIRRTDEHRNNGIPLTKSSLEGD
jgi:hypothetical protein